MFIDRGMDKEEVVQHIQRNITQNEIMPPVATWMTVSY